jgi:aspartokinase/homoserine dehydrogenase 1
MQEHLDSDLTNSLVKRHFADLPRVSLVPGLSYRQLERHHYQLPCGSDFTAAIIAAPSTLGVEIWTDVKGFMTADPSHQTALTIDELSYIEARSSQLRARSSIAHHLPAASRRSPSG